jgi:hypothetical protein
MPLKPTKYDFLVSSLATRTDHENCWNWPYGCNPKGYGSVCIGKSRCETTHRTTYRLTHGSIPDDLWVLHKCDNRKCFNPSHLFLGTNQDNIDDMVAKGRGNGGQLRPTNGNHWRKVSPEEVREIRHLHTEGTSRNELAKRFPIGASNMWCIIRRKTWKHIA